MYTVMKKVVLYLICRFTDSQASEVISYYRRKVGIGGEHQYMCTVSKQRERDEYDVSWYLLFVEII